MADNPVRPSVTTTTEPTWILCGPAFSTVSQTIWPRDGSSPRTRMFTALTLETIDRCAEVRAVAGPAQDRLTRSRPMTHEPVAGVVVADYRPGRWNPAIPHRRSPVAGSLRESTPRGDRLSLSPNDCVPEAFRAPSGGSADGFAETSRAVMPAPEHCLTVLCGEWWGLEDQRPDCAGCRLQLATKYPWHRVGLLCSRPRKR